ncbi:MAG: hypothetical protein AAF389_18285 [Gemmatimonadota bacterium]
MKGRFTGQVRLRGGVTIAEIVVAVLLSVAVVHLSVRAYAELRVAGTHHAQLRARLGDLRHTRIVLAHELDGGAVSDWRAFAPDSVGLRAYRGTAFPCGVPLDSTTHLVARSAGRAPDPTKDSVRILDADGGWHTVDLEGVARPVSAACPDSGVSLEVWRVSRSVKGASLFRIFETGSYHVTDALRYRRGRSGRQPLTGAGIDGYHLSSVPGRLDLDHPDSDHPIPLGRRGR